MKRTVRRHAELARPSTRRASLRDQPLPASRDEAIAARDATPQVRTLPPTSLRALADDDGPQIVGKGAVTGERITFGRFYQWDEEIAPGAFDGVLDDDVRSMFNHDPNWLLGRTGAGTMEIRIDGDDDLEYRTAIDADDAQAMSVHRKVDRGDVDGSSIMFMIAAETATYATEDNGLERDLYVITEIAPLYESGPVVFPAYSTTTAATASAPVEAVLRAAGVPEARLEDLTALAIADPTGVAARLRSVFGELPDLRDAACSCQRSGAPPSPPPGDGPPSSRRARYDALATVMEGV